jgi:Methyltransferase FkbM domain
LEKGEQMNETSGVIRSLAKWLRNYIPFGRISYSQEGEDLVLARILAERLVEKGFFVDIGAHHPTRYSNTYYFYRRGWRGLNVDALPGTKRLFGRMRPRDITIECGVGSQSNVMSYYAFNEPALNTFSAVEAKRKDQAPYHLVETIKIPIVPLRHILEQHMPVGTDIDFMTVDAEGFDHEIIISNDWAKYRPRVLLVELLSTELNQLDTHPTAKFLHDKGYRVIAKTFNTFFFVANEAFPQVNN